MSHETHSRCHVTNTQMQYDSFKMWRNLFLEKSHVRGDVFDVGWVSSSNTLRLERVSRRNVTCSHMSLMLDESLQRIHICRWCWMSLFIKHVTFINSSNILKETLSRRNVTYSHMSYDSCSQDDSFNINHVTSWMRVMQRMCFVASWMRLIQHACWMSHVAPVSYYICEMSHGTYGNLSSVASHLEFNMSLDKFPYMYHDLCTYVIWHRCDMTHSRCHLRVLYHIVTILSFSGIEKSRGYHVYCVCFVCVCMIVCMYLTNFRMYHDSFHICNMTQVRHDSFKMWRDVFTHIIWFFSCVTWLIPRGGGLGSRPKKMHWERLGDGVEYHLMSPTPHR